MFRGLGFMSVLEWPEVEHTPAMRHWFDMNEAYKSLRPQPYKNPARLTPCVRALEENIRSAPSYFHMGRVFQSDDLSDLGCFFCRSVFVLEDSG